MCGTVGFTIPLASALPLSQLARQDGDLRTGLVVVVVGTVLGVAGIAFGIIARRSAATPAPNRRRGNVGIWLGASAILTSVILFVVLVVAAVSTFEF